MVHADTGHVRGLPRRDTRQSTMAACGVNTADPLTTGFPVAALNDLTRP